MFTCKGLFSRAAEKFWYKNAPPFEKTWTIIGWVSKLISINNLTNFSPIAFIWNLLQKRQLTGAVYLIVINLQFINNYI